MNCAQSEQLMDAFLDGELSGSLQLEFDAHRLRCRRCQLTVAMLESVGDVVARDHSAPALPANFTDRVMTAIDRRRPLSLRLRSTRVAVVAGALLQAAAVYYLAVVVPSKPGQLPVGHQDSNLVRTALVADERPNAPEPFYDEIVSRVNAAGTNLTTELNQLARYPLALSVSDEYARATAKAVDASPVSLFLEALLPDSARDTDSPLSTATDEHSL